ncbi:MAG: hypothetical protein ABR616_18800 [Dermatophilaceae bacterium]|nr:hypothetical protein [Intrasporangiaceae bacterium]
MDMLNYAEQDVALSWHLRSNHYPPLPAEFIPLAKQAIELGVQAILMEDDNLWEAMLTLPNVPIIPRQAVDGKCSVAGLVESMHLDAFIDAAVEDIYGEEE